MVIGIIGICVAFAVLIFFCYKGCNNMYIAPVSAGLVALACGLPLLDTLTGYVDGGVVVGAFSNGFAGFVVPLLPMFLLALLLGQVYIASGAALNIAITLMKVLVRDGNKEKKQRAAVLVCVIVSFLLVFGGMDAFCSLFILFPIIITIMSEADIPRKFTLGLICCGVTAGSCAPGSPSTINYICMGILGTSTTASPVIGIIGTLIIGVGGVLYLLRAVKKAAAKGERFEPGKTNVKKMDPTRKYPPFFLSIVPLIVVFVVFNIVENLPVALFFGLLSALVLLSWFIHPENGNTKIGTLVQHLNEGSLQAAQAMVMGGIIGGLAAVIQTTSAYAALVNAMLSWKIPVAILAVLCITILVGLTGNSTVAAQVALPTLSASLGNISNTALHRLCVISVQTLDTAPFQSPILILLAMADLKHKDGYPPMAVCTVILPFIAAMVGALLVTAFPGIG